MCPALIAAVFALFAWTPGASAATTHHHIRCHRGHVAKRVRVRRRSHKHPGQFVWVRKWRCVKAKHHAAPVVTTPTPAPASPSVVAPTNPSSPAVRANLDPSYTQDASDWLRVTWDYSAGVTDGTLPPGTLSLAVSEPNAAGASGGCIINVGGTTTGGTCTVELPQYGDWNVTVTYNGASATVAPSTQTDTEKIEPPPATVNYQWGTDSPSNAPTVAAVVKGSTADVTVSDSNFEGAASVAVTDNLGDGCSAPVAGTQATCQMPVTGTPSSFVVGYPGGASSTGTRTVPPNGTQPVTYNWPADNVNVPNPNVTVQQAIVTQCGDHVPLQQNTYDTCSFGSPTNWLNPINIGTGTHIQLFTVVYGSLASDRDPTHGEGYVSGYLTYAVTAPDGAQFTTTSQQGSTPDGSADCSKVLNQVYLGGDASNPANYGPDEPVGGCDFMATTPGAYTIRVSYTSEDTNYVSVANGASATVNVQ